MGKSKKIVKTNGCSKGAQKPLTVKNESDLHSKHVSAPYPHFRYYKKSRHPALIVGEHSEDEYRYRKVMHGTREGNRNNEIISPNPNKADKEPMCIARRVRHDKKNAFGNRSYPWKYPNNKKK